MVVIRLSRGGSKKRPFYHIVAADKRCARDSKYLETLGFFNPIASGKETRLEVKEDLLNKWISKGAIMSERVKSLITKSKKDTAAA